MPWILQILRTLGHSQVCAIHSCSPGKLLKGDFRDPLMVSFPYYSHIFRDSYGSGMGIAWERGPIIEGPENPTELQLHDESYQLYYRKKTMFLKGSGARRWYKVSLKKTNRANLYICTCPTSTKVILETNILYHLKKTSGPTLPQNKQIVENPARKIQAAKSLAKKNVGLFLDIFLEL